MIEELFKNINVGSYIAFLLQCISEIAVCIRKVWLQLNGTTVSINGQVNQTLLIVHTRQVSMDNSMVRAQAEGTQITSNSPVRENDMHQIGGKSFESKL